MEVWQLSGLEVVILPFQCWIKNQLFVVGISQGGMVMQSWTVSMLGLIDGSKAEFGSLCCGDG